jgi:hypothetical protein
MALPCQHHVADGKLRLGVAIGSCALILEQGCLEVLEHTTTHDEALSMRQHAADITCNS